MYDLSSSLARRARASDLLLRAERRADGRRTFKIIRGEPEPTSDGRDLYEVIFAR
jgi:hypothetical protein